MPSPCSRSGTRRRSRSGTGPDRLSAVSRQLSARPSASRAPWRAEIPRGRDRGSRACLPSVALSEGWSRRRKRGHVVARLQRSYGTIPAPWELSQQSRTTVGLPLAGRPGPATSAGPTDELTSPAAGGRPSVRGIYVRRSPRSAPAHRRGTTHLAVEKRIVSLRSATGSAAYCQVCMG